MPRGSFARPCSWWIKPLASTRWRIASPLSESTSPGRRLLSGGSAPDGERSASPAATGGQGRGPQNRLARRAPLLLPDRRLRRHLDGRGPHARSGPRQSRRTFPAHGPRSSGHGTSVERGMKNKEYRPYPRHPDWHGQDPPQAHFRKDRHPRTLRPGPLRACAIRAC